MFHRGHRGCGEQRFARGEWYGVRHGGFRHGMPGGGGRLFDHGDLRLVILRLIAEKPRYGYEIIKAIEEKLAGAYSPSPGVVYPTLTMLEELGYVVGASAGAKKLYSITDEGKAFLEANRPAVDAIFARIDEIGQGGGPAPQIVRAWHSLKLALRMRVARGPLSEEQVQAIVAALDAAVAAVERS
jgi:DNA-binding PadR family transcriptional regulator